MFQFVSIFAVCMVLFGATSHAQSHTLILEIEEAIPDSGELKIAIYDSEESFMNVSKAVRTSVVDMEEEVQTRFEFNDLPVGTYAIAVMQDMNKNGALDSGMFGPTEPYGFSNNARGMFGPPSFKDASFKLDGVREVRIVVH